MSLRQKLYDRYFTGVEEASEIEEQREKQRIGAITDWVGRPFYREFVEFLKTSRKAHDCPPGPHESMLYTAGVRDGYVAIQEYLERLEQEVKEYRERNN